MTINKIIYSILLLGCFTMQAQVKVGTSPTIINSSALFEMESVQKGFLPPRMTTAQQAAIASPAKGLVLYNTTLDCLQINKGTPASPNWECIGASAAPTLVADCNASRFALSSPAQDPLCNGLFTGTSGYQVKFVLTNNSLSAVSGLDLSAAVSLTGAGAAGLTVTAGQNSNVSVNSAASVTLTYNFTGSPTTAGAITATFSRLGLTCTITNTVADPATWVGNGLDGTTAPNANYSCLAIKNAFPSSADGVYWIDPDGSCTAFNAMQAQCDMTTDGGGWMLIHNLVHKDDNTRASIIRSTFPLKSVTEAMGNDESLNTTSWGLSSPTLLTTFSGRTSTLRLYVHDGFASRIRHVKSTNSDFLNLVLGVSGSGGTICTLPMGADLVNMPDNNITTLNNDANCYGSIGTSSWFDNFSRNNSGFGHSSGGLINGSSGSGWGLKISGGESIAKNNRNTIFKVWIR